MTGEREYMILNLSGDEARCMENVTRYGLPGGWSAKNLTKMVSLTHVRDQMLNLHRDDQCRMFADGFGLEVDRDDVEVLKSVFKDLEDPISNSIYTKLEVL